jgi:hypothetical protein
MGKHETGYARVGRDFYPTREPWVVAALAEHVDLHGLTIWEHACGDGAMVKPLLRAGRARVYASDIIDGGAGQDEVLDYLSGREPNLTHYDGMITNPPFGPRGTLAVAFIKAGLTRTAIAEDFWRCCCLATSTRRRLAPATSATAHTSLARSCCASASFGSSATMESARTQRKTAHGFCGVAAYCASTVRRSSSTRPPTGVAAMIDMALAVIVVAALLLALAVDLAALAGWLRMRWRSPPMGRPTSRREWFHKNGSLKSRRNLLGGGFGSLLRSVSKHHERLELLRGDVEPVSHAARNAHFHDIANLPHAEAPPAASSAVSALVHALGPNPVQKREVAEYVP